MLLAPDPNSTGQCAFSQALSGAFGVFLLLSFFTVPPQWCHQAGSPHSRCNDKRDSWVLLSPQKLKGVRISCGFWGWMSSRLTGASYCYPRSPCQQCLYHSALAWNCYVSSKSKDFPDMDVGTIWTHQAYMYAMGKLLLCLQFDVILSEIRTLFCVCINLKS